MTEQTATERLATLVEQRARASARVDELEVEQRQASATLAAAREAVAEFHRHGGGKPVDQKRLEGALAEAQSRFNEPWGERIEGARRAARDAQIPVRSFVGENLDALVRALQADGQSAAERINAGAVEMVAGYGEWSRIAQEISQVVSLVAQVKPGDVSFSRCEPLMREVSRLLDQGGESGPVWRDRRAAPLAASA